MVFGISLANNLDNTGVGIAYGVGRIRLPALFMLWISVITLAITGTAVALGNRIGHLLPTFACKVLSAVILCTIGVLVLRPALASKKDQAPAVGNAITRVLADPEVADADQSRHIDYREGTLLGVALSINNIGGGISAGLVGLSVIATGLTSAAMSYLVLWLGGVLGRRLGAGPVAERAPILAGILLIVIGLCQFR
jgi:putative sporulation protein YtaF